MSQDIAAVILVLAAAVLPIVITVLTRRQRRRSYRGTVKVPPGIRIRADDVPRRFATGRPRPGRTGTWSPALGDFAAKEPVSKPS